MDITARCFPEKYFDVIQGLMGIRQNPKGALGKLVIVIIIVIGLVYLLRAVGVL